MPFLIQQRTARHRTTRNYKIPTDFPLSEHSQAEMRGPGDNRLNLSQLQLQPAPDREELTLSLEADGHLVGEEIYWLQTEILLENEVVWRGEVGVFYEETLPNIHFTGRIPLPAARLWSPQEPNLYALHLTLFRGAKFLNRVETYFGLDKVSTENGQMYRINQSGWEPAQ